MIARNPTFFCCCEPPCPKGSCDTPVLMEGMHHTISRNHKLDWLDTKKQVMRGLGNIWTRKSLPAVSYKMCNCDSICSFAGRSRCISGVPISSASIGERPLMLDSSYHLTFPEGEAIFHKSCMCKPFCLAAGKLKCDKPVMVAEPRLMFKGKPNEPEKFRPKSILSDGSGSKQLPPHAAFSPCYLFEQSKHWYKADGNQFVPHHPLRCGFFPLVDRALYPDLSWMRCKQGFLPRESFHHGNTSSPTISIIASKKGFVHVATRSRIRRCDLVHRQLNLGLHRHQHP